jgi:hypothetical protein
MDSDMLISGASSATGVGRSASGAGASDILDMLMLMEMLMDVLMEMLISDPYAARAGASAILLILLPIMRS